jgi:hypothetical protein
MCVNLANVREAVREHLAARPEVEAHFGSRIQRRSHGVETVPAYPASITWPRSGRSRKSGLRSSAKAGTS